ncbi:MAG: hydroxymethylbilane synthase [bacterium]|nr:hydroxymethylbilane synthase [bacterium]MCP5070691.1 hydroxymethylbilane synthase [bacterium]
MKLVRIATRGSALALAQSGHVAQEIESALRCRTELVKVQTTGDRIQDRSLAAIGGKGLFVKEIEEALLDGRADVAVHSAKDLPPEQAPGLVLAAFPKRADARDALIGRPSGATVETLPRGCRVGTGSVRRASQLLAYRPDLVIVPIRGNVDTRLRKLEEEDLAAVVLASAGLDRLGLEARIDERIDEGLMLPAVGQGTLALECRQGEALADDLLAIDHPPTRVSITAERAFLEVLAGDCHAPIAGRADLLPDGRVKLRARVLAPDGRQVVTAEATGSAADADALGRAAAREALGRGALRLIEAAREGSTA